MRCDSASIELQRMEEIAAVAFQEASEERSLRAHADLCAKAHAEEAQMAADATIAQVRLHKQAMTRSEAVEQSQAKALAKVEEVSSALQVRSDSLQLMLAKHKASRAEFDVAEDRLAEVFSIAADAEMRCDSASIELQRMEEIRALPPTPR
eukprot:TRINITY_DN8739_c0_g1_i1.p1 TRINITY_DN8739_c0_g1~~TRINITY_DN8739_c0_g1_i1.p1  ORF type:complete len:151 (+),score=38.58 TRINITY_DN8739_c0_g1_i1:82-534(+)